MDEVKPDTVSVEKRSPLRLWIRRVFIAIVVLLLLIILLLQFAVVQTWLSTKVTKYLSEATNTTVTAERLKISPFDGVILQNFDIKDSRDNTIVHGGALNLSLSKNIFFLLNNRLDLSYIGVKDIRLNIITELGENKSNIQKFLDNLSTSPATKSKSAPLDFRLKEVDLSDIYVKIDNKNKGKYHLITLAGGNFDINYIDLICKDFDLNAILLDHPTYQSHIYEYDCSIDDELSVVQKSVSQIDDSSEPITLTFREFAINGGKFGLSNALIVTEQQFKDYLDYNNFFFDNINVLLKDFSFRNNSDILARLETFSASDNTGFEIHNIKSDTIILNSTSAEFRSFTIDLGKTQVKNQLKFNFADFASFSEFTDKVILNAEFKESKIYLNDLSHFVKNLSKVSFISGNSDEYIHINGRFYGKINSLAGRDVDIRMGEKLSIAGSFNTRNLLDPDNTVLNIRLDRFMTSMRKIKMIIPSFNPPQNFYKLGSINFTGRFDGYLEDFVAYGKLRSDVGTAEMDMRLDITQGSNKANYSGTLNLFNFNLGRWSDNKDLGLVNFKSKVDEGKGLTLNTVKADLIATVNSLVYKKYNYKDFVIDGKIDKNTFNGVFKIQDENIDFLFDGSFEYLDKQVFLNFKSDVKNINLQALNLSSSPLSFQAKMDINVTGSNLNDFTGDIKMSDFRMRAKDSIYNLTSLDLTSKNTVTGGKLISIMCDLGIINLNGEYDLPNIAKSIKKILYTNYPYITKSWKQDIATVSAKQKFDFNFSLQDSKNFLSLIGLDNSYFKRLSLKGRLDSYKNEISIASDIPILKINKDSVNNLQLLVTADRKSGDILVHIDSTFVLGRHFNPIDLNTTLKGDTLNFSFSTEKLIDSLENFDIKGQMIPHQKGYNLTLADNLLVMLGTKWKIDKTNNIVFGEGYVNLDNLILSDGQRSIGINDINNNRGLKLEIDNFNVDIVNGFIKYDKMKFGGLTNVSGRIEDVFAKEKEIGGYLNIPQFTINGDSYGSIFIDVSKSALSPIKANISIGDFLAIKGTYDEKAKVVDSKIKLREAPMKIIEYLLKAGIKDTKGTIDADIVFGGPVSELKLAGDGILNKGKTTLIYTGTTYYFDKQKIKISNTAIDLDGAKITDQNGNFGTIKGGLVHKMFKDFGVNAVISGNNVVGLNTTKGDNPSYYGYGVGQLSAEFTGSFDKVDMKINAITGPGTKLFIPVDNHQLAINQSFIKFVEKGKNSETSGKKPFTVNGINVEMTITLTPDAEVSLIFNETRGDIIKGSGRGNMKIDITRQGDFEIFGNYEIEQGQYLFTVALLPVAKPFVVERGGTISWTGDPVNATLDITAKYRTRTSVEPFIAEYLTLASPDDQRLAGQNTEVDLQLKLGGSLYKPEIRFDLSFPNLTGDIANFADSKLRLLRNNELELNGQVLGLIVFNSFLPSNRVADVFGAAGIQSAGINTLSEFLTSQLSLFITNILNSMVDEGGLISGIDFDLNVRNNNFGISSSNNILPDEIAVRNTLVFKNNRFSVDIGGNYVIQNQGIAINQVLPDFALEFQLTEDRKLKVRLYGKYDIDPITITGLREKYGLGVAFRTEFGSMVDFEKNLKSKVSQIIEK